MKLDASSRTAIAVLVVIGLAVAFWMLLLAPKRQEASELGEEAAALRASLAQAQSAVATAEAAREGFRENYRELVVLGKAVPADDETSSLLVQINQVADDSNVTFESLQLGSENGSPEGGEAAPVTPTESAASAQPIGATVGPAGLSVLPYDLTFKGSFFDIADFIEGIDSLVRTREDGVGVDGRLVTLDGFALNGDGETGFPDLAATFSVTTYLVPAGEGITAGAGEEGPEEVAAASETPSNLR